MADESPGARRSDCDFQPIESFDLVGGRPCLDFTNTLSSYFEAERRDKLTGYGDLLVFATRTGLLDEAAARALAAAAARRPAEAARVLRAARALREALFVLFYPGQRGRAAALATVDADLGRARAREHLVPAGAGFTFAFEADDQALDRPLWPIAASAAALLTSPLIARVRGCGSARERCSWLFIDESKNGSRRWCSMRDCGNREKARRHYRRHRVCDPG